MLIMNRDDVFVCLFFIIKVIFLSPWVPTFMKNDLANIVLIHVLGLYLLKSTPLYNLKREREREGKKE